MAGNLGRRVGFAAVAIPAALGLVYLGGWVLATLVALIGVLGVKELFGFVPARDVAPMALPGFLSAAAIGPLVYSTLAEPAAARFWTAWWPYAGALWLILVLLWVLATRPPDGHPLEAAATTVLAVLYAAALPAFILVLRHGDHPMYSWPGTWLVFFPLMVIWVCDSFAMFGGMLIGGPKLAPVVSPGKTRSGGIAGIVGAVIVGAVFGWWVFPAAGVHAGPAHVLLIAFVLSIVGQFGDLLESLFKRGAGVKDSGTLIPGHGGILDRFDSLYFALPVCAFLYSALGVS
ncbi:MAG TPA: phosphatidate cytidylyltransferase [Gemmatimonadales bacterium]|nr:phosphatidate cytidylyltransferase [Gemmatimonadales bacterium]